MELKNFKFKSVLELGCGYGRITKAILENFKIGKYHVVDISPENLTRTFKIANGKVVVHEQDIRKLEINGKFDLVIAIEVLMHIPVNDIEETIKRMYGKSNQLIVHLDYTGMPKFQLASHCFIHRYFDIHEKLGGEIVNVKPVLNTQSLFTIIKQK